MAPATKGTNRHNYELHLSVNFPSVTKDVLPKIRFALRFSRRNHFTKQKLPVCTTLPQRAYVMNENHRRIFLWFSLYIVFMLMYGDLKHVI